VGLGRRYGLDEVGGYSLRCWLELIYLVQSEAFSPRVKRRRELCERLLCVNQGNCEFVRSSIRLWGRRGEQAVVRKKCAPRWA
jgi:hypothetical protein